MYSKLFFLISLVLLLSIVSNTSADLVAHWKLDDASGTIAAESIGGNNGALEGDPMWSAGWIGGALELDGDDFLDCGNSDTYNITEQVTLAAWIKPDPDFNYPDWSGIIMRGGPNIDTFAFYYNGPSQQLGFKTTGTSPSWFSTPAPDLFDNEWHHTAAIYDGTNKIVYLDGEEVGKAASSGAIETSAGRLLLGAGRDNTPPSHYLVGLIDDARIYDEGLPQVEIQAAMEGGEGYPFAFNPDPADGAFHADTWVNLSWRPGDLAVSHDVFLGESHDVVENATRDSDVYRGNQVSTFLVAGFPGFAYPEGLVPGTTYYWRIDEINDDDPNSPWKGPVWRFSVPPKTAYNPNPADGSGIAETTITLTWTAGFGAKLHTVYFGDDFDTVNTATVGVPRGTPTYDPGALEAEKVYYWRVDEFDGTGTFKGDVWTFTSPGAVGNPQPVNGATDVGMATVLSWTSADNAASHEVYLGVDKDGVRSADTSSPEYKGSRTLGAETYDAGLLDPDTTYYWRVDEVYNGNPVKGPVWSFTVGAYLLVDDFESYTDDDAAGQAIWQSWVDGFGIADNGAQVGYLMPPYAEQKIVHSGAQSMPLLYVNETGVTNSEASLTLSTTRDWTAGGVAELSLWVRGASINALDPLYVAISNAAGAPAIEAYDDPAIAQIGLWTEWVIPLQAIADQGINLTNVDKIAIGLGSKSGMASTGGTGTMYIDDIRLYRSEP